MQSSHTHAHRAWPSVSLRWSTGWCVNCNCMGQKWALLSLISMCFPYSLLGLRSSRGRLTHWLAVNLVASLQEKMEEYWQLPTVSTDDVHKGSCCMKCLLFGGLHINQRVAKYHTRCRSSMRVAGCVGTSPFQASYFYLHVLSCCLNCSMLQQSNIQGFIVRAIAVSSAIGASASAIAVLPISKNRVSCITVCLKMTCPSY